MGKQDEAKFEKWVRESFMPSVKPELHNSIQALINDEAAKTELMNGYLRQDDYSKKTQEAARLREEAEQLAAAQAQREAAYNAWYQEANQTFMAQQREIARLAGQTPQQQQNQPSPEAQALAAEFKAMKEHLAQIDRGTYTATIDLTRLAHKAFKEGYDYDPAKIVEISTKQGLSLDRAFDEYTADARKQREAAAVAKQLEEAREAGRREAMSNRMSPDAVGPASPVSEVLFGKATPTTNQYDRVAEAVAMFHEGYKGD